MPFLINIVDEHDQMYDPIPVLCSYLYTRRTLLDSVLHYCNIYTYGVCEYICILMAVTKAQVFIGPYLDLGLYKCISSM